MLRPYRPDDCRILADLFYHTVHTVNARDYTAEQLQAWATGQVDLVAWNESFLAHNTLVAERDGQIVGFGDMADDGYLDRLYVHKDWQRKGIATAICDALEAKCKVRPLVTYASITARPFFEARGYVVIRENWVERRGICLKNYRMEKTVSCPVKSFTEL